MNQGRCMAAESRHGILATTDEITVASLKIVVTLLPSGYICPVILLPIQPLTPPFAPHPRDITSRNLPLEYCPHKGLFSKTCSPHAVKNDPLSTTRKRPSPRWSLVSAISKRLDPVMESPWHQLSMPNPFLGPGAPQLRDSGVCCKRCVCGENDNARGSE